MARLALMLLAALTGFGAGLLWKMPAEHAFARLPEDRRPVIYGLDGRAVAGRIAALELGKLRLHGIRWAVQPASLLWLHPRVELSLESPLLARGFVQISPAGELRLGDWQAAGSLRPIAAAAGYGFLPVEGAVGLQLTRLRLSDRRPHDIHGRVELRNLVWTLGSQRLPIGDIEAIVEPDDGIETARIQDLGGPVEVAGTARLEPDGRYALDLRIKARASADPRLANLMSGLGRPDAQAYYPIRYQGRLPQ